MDRTRRGLGNQTAAQKVNDVIDAYLRLADAEAPGLIEGLYLTGSAVLDDFRPNTSDIDFVAVTTTPLDKTAIAALAKARVRLRKRFPRTPCDELYVTWDELKHEAASAGNAVAWQTLAHYGIACRGPHPADLGIKTDARALVRWTLDNLNTYWRPLLNHASYFLSPRSWIALTGYGAVWIVLGISRLHYTLATGDIISKEGAGLYALRTFPEKWHRVVNECLRIRRADQARPDIASVIAELFGRHGESLYGTPFSRRRDVLAFGKMVIAAATLKRPLPNGRGSED
jgi:Aminoglycoside adenylyltransferase, C-terminal domain